MPQLPHQRLLETAIASPSQAITRAIKVEYIYSNRGDSKKFPSLRKYEYDRSDKVLSEISQANRKLNHVHLLHLFLCHCPINKIRCVLKQTKQFTGRMSITYGNMYANVHAKTTSDKSSILKCILQYIACAGVDWIQITLGSARNRYFINSAMGIQVAYKLVVLNS
jgi:hypothetical protein